MAAAGLFAFSMAPIRLTEVCFSGKQFDVDGAILNVLKGLTVDLDVQSTVELDDSKHGYLLSRLKDFSTYI